MPTKIPMVLTSHKLYPFLSWLLSIQGLLLNTTLFDRIYTKKNKIDRLTVTLRRQQILRSQEHKVPASLSSRISEYWIEESALKFRHPCIIAYRGLLRCVLTFQFLWRNIRIKKKDERRSEKEVWNGYIFGLIVIGWYENRKLPLSFPCACLPQVHYKSSWWDMCAK